MRKYVVILLIVLLCTTVFTDTKSENTKGKSPLDKYLVPATITEMDWRLLRTWVTFIQISALQSHPFENYTWIGGISFDYDKKRIIAGVAICEERYDTDPEPFSSLPHIKKKDVVLNAVSFVKKNISRDIPEIENDSSLLIIRFTSFSNYDNTLAVYENGKLTPEW
jgi:hypothetical protein